MRGLPDRAVVRAKRLWPQPAGAVAADRWMNGAGGHGGDPLAGFHPSDKGHVAMDAAVFGTVIGGTPFSR